MKTTAIMIEFLVAGLLVLLAIFLFALSFIPGEMISFLNQINKSQHWLAKAPFLITILISIAYGFGILFEYIGFYLFEWIFDGIKAKKIEKYYRDNEWLLKKNPIFKNYKSIDTGQNNIDKASYHGEMRFYVLMENPTLYSEIELQLNRLRLIRVLFIVEAIIFAAVLKQLIREFTFVILMLLFLFSIFIFFNVKAILHRFSRYCRAIERSFKMLNLKKLKK